MRIWSILLIKSDLKWCIRRNRSLFLYIDVQNTTNSSHGAPCHAQDVFPWLNTRVKVHISVWTIREYSKRHSPCLSDSGDTFLPLNRWRGPFNPDIFLCKTSNKPKYFFQYFEDNSNVKKVKSLWYTYIASTKPEVKVNSNALSNVTVKLQTEF